MPPSKAGDQTTSSTPAFTPSCLSRAVRKARENLPENPAKFAVVIDRLLDTKSPRKRKALADRSIHSHTSQKELDYAAALEEEVGKQYQELRKSKKKQHSTICKSGAAECQVLEKEVRHQLHEEVPLSGFWLQTALESAVNRNGAESNRLL